MGACCMYRCEVEHRGASMTSLHATVLLVFGEQTPRTRVASVPFTPVSDSLVSREGLAVSHIFDMRSRYFVVMRD